MVYSKDDRTDLLLSLLVEDCGNDDVEEFRGLDISDVTFSKKYYRKKKRIINGAFWNPIITSFRKIAAKVAIVFLVILSTGFLTVMSVPSLRESVVETVRELFDDHEEINFSDGDDKTSISTVGKIEKVNKPTVLPDGVEEEILIDSKTTYMCEYYMGDEYIATFTQVIKKESTKIHVNIEDCTVYSISIYDRKLRIYDNTRTGDITVFWEDKNYAYTMDGLDLDLLLDLIGTIE